MIILSNSLKLLNANYKFANLRYFCRPDVINQRNSSTNSKTVDLAHNTYENLKRGEPEAPPLIIMHGLFGSKQNWRSLCKAIQQRTEPYRKVIAIDARNHGESPHTSEHRYDLMVQDVVAFLNKNGIKKAAVLGHSMGGRVMMYLALKYPELVEKAIFVDISPITTSPSLTGMLSLFESLKTVKVPSNIAPSQARLFADQHLSATIDDKSVRDFLLTNLIQKADGSYGWRVNVDALCRNFVSDIARFPDDGLKLKYDGAALFIGGSKSDYIRKSDLKRIKKLFPKSHFSFVSDAGHRLHREEPELFLFLVKLFLNHSDPTPAELPQMREIFPSANLVMVQDAGHWVHSEKPTELLKIVLEFLKIK